MIRGLMTDEEWAIFMPFLTTASSRGGRPPTTHRHRLDGILWICRTGAPWRDLPAAFGKMELGVEAIPSLVQLSPASGTFCFRRWPTAAAHWTCCR